MPRTTAAFKKVTETHSVREMGAMLGDGEGTPIAVFTGIGCRHNVFMRHSDSALIYFESVESGPREALQQSWSSPREMQVWIPNLTLRDFHQNSRNIAATTREVVNLAMNNALSEVEQEMEI